jgi:hypothetical protein
MHSVTQAFDYECRVVEESFLGAPFIEGLFIDVQRVVFRDGLL